MFLIDPYRFGSAPADTSVLRILGDNGTSTTFLDRSPSAKTITTFGSAINSTTTVGTGAYSISLPSAGSYLTVPDSTDWNTDGNATWEVLYYIDLASWTAGDIFPLISQSSVGSARHVFFIQADSSSAATMYYLETNAGGTQALTTLSASVAPRTVGHGAVVFGGIGNTLRTFFNGTAGSTNVQITPTDCTTALHIGVQSDNGSVVAGRNFIGNLKVRITPSILYTTTFTAPTDFT